MNTTNSREESQLNPNPTFSSDLTLQKNSFQFTLFSIDLQTSFQNIMKEPEQYLEHILNSDDSPLFANTPPDTRSLIPEAKTRFKESALALINSIRKDSESKISLFPDSFFRQTVESLKHQMFLSYKSLMQSVAKSILEDQDIIDPAQIEPSVKPVRTKLKPGKTKFPRTARNILSSWYEGHKDDPFPSYAEKVRLAEECGITLKQVKCWFINMRRKRWNKEEDTDFSKQIKKKLENGVEDGENEDTML